MTPLDRLCYVKELQRLTGFVRPGFVLVASMMAMLVACVPPRTRSVASSPERSAESPRASASASSPRPLATAARARREEAPRPSSDAEYLRSRDLMVPVDGIAPARVPDNFSAPRGSRRHNALDILAPRGTPVLAADDGRILSMRRNSAGGITIYLVDAEERMIHYYAHLDGYRKGLGEGDRVTKGDVIGYVGTTGNAPANTPHLHFQVMRLDDLRRYWEGTPVNPHGFFTEPGRKRD